MGPAASQVAIKQLGTNGGGCFGANSAHPFENPTPLSNLMEMISILVIPVALCFTFGKCVNDKKQGVAIFLAMMIILLGALTVTAVQEQGGTAQLEQDGAVDIRGENQAGGNMEGKEARFGIATSVTWTVFTPFSYTHLDVYKRQDGVCPYNSTTTSSQTQPKKDTITINNAPAELQVGDFYELEYTCLLYTSRCV